MSLLLVSQPTPSQANPPFSCGITTISAGSKKKIAPHWVNQPPPPPLSRSAGWLPAQVWLGQQKNHRQYRADAPKKDTNGKVTLRRNNMSLLWFVMFCFHCSAAFKVTTIVASTHGHGGGNGGVTPPEGSIFESPSWRPPIYWPPPKKIWIYPPPKKNWKFHITFSKNTLIFNLF